MVDRAVVLDANILVRAVLGRRNRDLIERYAEEVSFFVPEIVLGEAKDNLPKLVVNRGGDPEKALAVLDALACLVELIGTDVYGSFEEIARERIGARDPDDWPVLAAALARVPDLDGRYRLLRVWGGHVDFPTGREISREVRLVPST